MKAHSRVLFAVVMSSALALGVSAPGAQAATGSIKCSVKGFTGTLAYVATTGGRVQPTYTIKAPAASAKGKATIAVTDWAVSPIKRTAVRGALQDGKRHKFGSPYRRGTGKAQARFVFDGPGTSRPTCTASNVI